MFLGGASIHHSTSSIAQMPVAVVSEVRVISGLCPWWAEVTVTGPSRNCWIMFFSGSLPTTTPVAAREAGDCGRRLEAERLADDVLGVQLGVALPLLEVHHPQSSSEHTLDLLDREQLFCGREGEVGAGHQSFRISAGDQNARIEVMRPCSSKVITSIGSTS